MTPIQPPEPIPGEAKPPGGWTLVFRSLAQGDHLEALARNDYVVIHIDTDVSEDSRRLSPARSRPSKIGRDHLRTAGNLGGKVGDPQQPSR